MTASRIPSRCAPQVQGGLKAIIAAVACMLGLFTRPALAQQDSATLAVQATVAYDVIWNKQALNATDFSGRLLFGHALGGRFSGRVALAIAHRLLLGVAVGSWATGSDTRVQYTPVVSLHALGALATAVLASGYVQFYPVRSGVFLRGGAGYAAMSTYYPDDPFGLTAFHHVRMTVGGGIGIDIPLARHLALTPSVDLTIPLGSTAGELRSGVAAGLGLTVR